MSKTIDQTSVAAHLNALKSQVHALEVQITVLKTVMADLDGGASTTEPKAKPAKEKPAKAKPAKAAEIDDEIDDEIESDESDDEAEESDDDDAEEEDEETPPAKVTKKVVIKALQDYMAEHDRAASMKVLKKFGVASVHDLDPAKYGKIVAALAI